MLQSMCIAITKASVLFTNVHGVRRQMRITVPVLLLDARWLQPHDQAVCAAHVEPVTPKGDKQSNDQVVPMPKKGQSGRHEPEFTELLLGEFQWSKLIFLQAILDAVMFFQCGNYWARPPLQRPIQV